MKTSSSTPYSSDGLGAKKTMFVMVTVVGCIAILWPKVFYPMMFGSSPPIQPYKDLRTGSGSVKCCEVILDKETFLNTTGMLIGPQLYRKNIHFLVDEEISLRQERPSHLRPEGIHPAMRERGRAIPNTQTVPIVDRARNPPPKIVEGRPGPIPGMRPPMGAGSVHQAQPKGNSMGIVMPLYTIGIIAFFCYTIMKLVVKKPQPNEPYGAVPEPSTFKKDVFGASAGKYKGESPTIGWKEQAARYYNGQVSDSDISGRKHVIESSINHNQNNSNNLCSTNNNGVITNIKTSSNTANAIVSVNATIASTTTSMKNASTTSNGVNHNYNNSNNNIENNNKNISNGHVKQLAIRRSSQHKDRDQLMEIEWLRKKLEETEKAMAKLIAEMNSTQFHRKDTNGISNQNGNISNGHATKHHHADEENVNSKVEDLTKNENPSEKLIDSEKEHAKQTISSDKKKREGSVEKAVTVMGMELTASFEGGHKWNRPTTPEFPHHQHSSQHQLNGDIKPKSIYLEGSLPHESQILVSDSETTTERATNLDYDEDDDEPAVVLSSKISLSLINVNSGANVEVDNENNDEIDAVEEDKKDEIYEEDQHVEEEQLNSNEEIDDEN